MRDLPALVKGLSRRAGKEKLEPVQSRIPNVSGKKKYTQDYEKFTP